MNDRARKEHWVPLASRVPQEKRDARALSDLREHPDRREIRYVKQKTRVDASNHGCSTFLIAKLLQDLIS